MDTAAAKTGSKAAKNRAPGAITGVNHLVLSCTDMEKTLAFYRDILGLSVRTHLSPTSSDRERPADWIPGPFYWLELGNGDIIAIREVAQTGDPTPDASFAAALWPVERPKPPVIKKMDHLALNVDSLEDLKALRQRLIDKGWPVSDVNYRSDLVHSIYFYDPDWTPLEAATWARPGDGAPDTPTRYPSLT